MEELTDLGYRFKEFTNTLEEFGAFVSEAGMGIFIVMIIVTNLVNLIL